MRMDPLFGFAFLGIAVFIARHISVNSAATWLLVWPALSLALVALAFLSGSPRVFGKSANGRRSWTATLLLAPYLLFARVVWEVQTRISSEPACNSVNPPLIVARWLRGTELPHGIAAIVDLTSEMGASPAARQHRGYLCAPLLDANGLEPVDLVRLVLRLPPEPAGPLLIHCANGHGRTGTIAAAWLIAHSDANTPEEALLNLTAVRPAIRLRGRQRKDLTRAALLLNELKLFGDIERQRIALILREVLTDHTPRLGTGWLFPEAELPQIHHASMVAREIHQRLNREFDTNLSGAVFAHWNIAKHTSLASVVDSCQQLIQQSRRHPLLAASAFR